MIAGWAKGQGVTGTWQYITSEGKDENGKRIELKEGEKSRAVFIGGNGFEGLENYDQEYCVKIMENNASPAMQAHKKNICVKDASHFWMSWAPGQEPSNEQMNQAARNMMKAVGMEDAMWLGYAHIQPGKKRHVHIVASNVKPSDGYTYDDYQRQFKLMRFGVVHERENNEITPATQWMHDRANATEHGTKHDVLMHDFFKTEATVKHTKVRQAFVYGGFLGEELEAKTRDFIDQNELIGLKKHQAIPFNTAYTTKDIYIEEAHVLKTAHEVKEQSGFGVDQKRLEKYEKQYKLNKEQKSVLWETTRDNGLAIISGEAGTGKTHNLKAIRDALQVGRRTWQDAGYKVKAGAFTNQVTLDLQEAGFDAMTIDSQLKRLESGKEKFWDEKTIVVVDEASQLSTRHMKEIMRHAKENKTKLILCGHSEQLGSIERGGLFPVMEKRFGSAKLTEVVRNKQDADIWHDMAKGKWKDAVDKQKEKNIIKWYETDADARKSIVEENKRVARENPDAKRIILAATNLECAEINKEIRNDLKEHGKLGKEINIGEKQFAINDRIVMRNTPDQTLKGKGLINGAFGNITGVDSRSITVSLDQKEQTFRLVYNGRKQKDEIRISEKDIDHGYAVTDYRSQGRTLHIVDALHNPQSNRTGNYVKSTRYTQEFRLHVSKEGTRDYDELIKQVGQGDRKTAAHEYVIANEHKHKLEKKDMNFKDVIHKAKNMFNPEKSKHEQENGSAASFLVTIDKYVAQKDQKGVVPKEWLETGNGRTKDQTSVTKTKENDQGMGL